MFMITIELVGNKSKFKPYEVIRGNLCWSFGEKDKAFRYIDVNLGWIASNDRAEDAMCHAHERFRIKTKSGSSSFEVMLPCAPCSYKGELFCVNWFLEASSPNKQYVTSVSICVE